MRVARFGHPLLLFAVLGNLAGACGGAATSPGSTPLDSGAPVNDASVAVDGSGELDAAAPMLDSGPTDAIAAGCSDDAASPGDGSAECAGFNPGACGIACSPMGLRCFYSSALTAVCGWQCTWICTGQ